MKTSIKLIALLFLAISLFSTSMPTASASELKRVRSVSSSEQKKKEQKKAEENKAKSISNTSTASAIKTSVLLPVQVDNRICSQYKSASSDILLAGIVNKK